MAYQIAEKWRPLNPADGMKPEDFLGFKEGLVEILVGGPRLAYVRNIDGVMGRDQTLFMRTQTHEDNNWTWFARMIQGGIAVYAVPEGQMFIEHPVACDLRGYMQVVARELEGLVQYYQDIPTKNPTYEREREILRKIHKEGEKFLRGREPICGMDIFWGFGTPWGEPGIIPQGVILK